MESITTRIEKQRFKWFGHITRMCENSLVKRLWEARITRDYVRGRQKKVWNDEIVSILERRGVIWTKGRRLGKDKSCACYNSVVEIMIICMYDIRHIKYVQCICILSYCKEKNVELMAAI